MKRRCDNVSQQSYIYYGARGISVCDEWRNDFMAFYNWSMDNGYIDGLQIDRINVDDGYSPENCRWVTRSDNSQNRRMRGDNTTGYVGITKRGNKWYSSITDKGCNYHIGVFNTPKDAAIAYNNWVMKLGSNHRLNVIDD
jgi:hypothetical protein